MFLTFLGGDFLFDRTMSYCSSDAGWTINADAGAKVKELDDTKVEWNIIQDELKSLGLPFSAQLSLGYKWDPKGTIIYLFFLPALIIVPIFLAVVAFKVLAPGQ